MKKLFTLLLVFCCFGAIAQNGTIMGLVTEEGTDEPLPFVNISLVINDNTTGTQTDFDGNYTISAPAGTYELTFTYVGFTEQKQEVTVVAGQTTTLNVILGEEATLLNTVVVTGNKFEKPLGEVTVSMEVIKPDLIENNNDTRMDQSLERIPGVTMIDGQANIRGGSGFSYGAGSRVLLLIDDMPALSGDAGYPDWDAVPVENISQVEVIKGAASALYGSSAMNGIINVRTAYPSSKPKTKISTFFGMNEYPKGEDGNFYNDDVWWTYKDKDGKLKVPLLAGSLTDSISRVPAKAGINFLHSRKIGKNFDLVVGANTYAEDSWRLSEYSRRMRINVNTRYRINDNMSIGVNVNYSRRKSANIFLWGGDIGIPDILGGGQDEAYNVDSLYISWSSLDNPTNKITTYNIDPFFVYANEKGVKHKVLTRYYDRFLDTDTGQDLPSKFIYGEYQFQKNWADKNFTLTSGITGNYAWSNAELYAGDVTLKSFNTALYAQGDVKLWEKLNLSLGVRLERNGISSTKPDIGLYVHPISNDSTYSDILAPDPNNYDFETKPVFRFGANYQAGKATFIRASVGQGYRFPTIAEKFVYTDLTSADSDNPLNALLPSILPNPNLKSETGISAEFGVKQGFKVGEWKAYADVSAFYTRYNDMMEFTFLQFPDTLNGIPYQNHVTGQPSALGDFMSLNIGDTEIIGTEVTLAGTGQLFDLMPTNVLLGYTFIEPRFQLFDSLTNELTSTDENVLKYRFRHTVKANLEMTLGPVTLGNTIIYASSMEAVDQAFLDILPMMEPWYLEEQKKKGNARWDARITFNIKDGMYNIALIGQNLMNNVYVIRPGLIEAPRSWQIKFSAQF